MKTAAIAGLAVWSAIAHIAATHGPHLVTFVGAAIAGAWVYREDFAEKAPTAALA